jgi:hypothetical protein
MIWMSHCSSRSPHCYCGSIASAASAWYVALAVASVVISGPMAAHCESEVCLIRVLECGGTASNEVSKRKMERQHKLKTGAGRHLQPRTDSQTHAAVLQENTFLISAQYQNQTDRTAVKARSIRNEKLFRLFRTFKGWRAGLAKGQIQRMALIFDSPSGNSLLRKWTKYRGDHKNGLAIGNHLKSRDHSRNISPLYSEIFFWGDGICDSSRTEYCHV